MSSTIKAHIGAAIILCISGVFGSVKLIEMKFIGEVSFVALLCFIVLISLLVAFMWKIESFKAGASSIEVKLRQMKETEDSIKALAKAMVELSDASEGSYKVHGWDPERYQEAKRNLKLLAT